MAKTSVISVEAVNRRYERRCRAAACLSINGGGSRVAQRARQDHVGCHPNTQLLLSKSGIEFITSSVNNAENCAVMRTSCVQAEEVRARTGSLQATRADQLYRVA